MVAPDFKEEKLTKQIESIATSMFRPAGITARIDYSMLDEQLLQPRVKLAIYRIVQEQCTNIIKHANAKNVFSKLQFNTDQVILTIKDDGIGFDMQTLGLKRSLDLLGMKERTLMIDGHFEIRSKPGEGTTIVVTTAVQPEGLSKL